MRIKYENIIQTKFVALIKMTIVVFGFVASHVFLEE
jgi:hypothetical protein